MVSSYLFLSMCNCVGALCTLMFQLQVACLAQISINHLDFVEGMAFKYFINQLFQSASQLSIEIYQAFGIGSLMVLFLFLFCYFGEMVSDRSLVIANSAWHTLWYLYPLELQKYVQMSIAYSHIEFHFSGMGLMYCTMASFSGVRLLYQVHKWIHTHC